MCAACVAQGIGYVGASVATLRLMSARAASRRGHATADVGAIDSSDERDGSSRETMSVTTAAEH